MNTKEIKCPCCGKGSAMKYLLKKPIRKMTEAEFKENTAYYTENEKALLLQYMKSFSPCAFTSEPVRDIFSGKIVVDADNARSDGEYRWCESEIYHFEKYNLKINDDFVHHVLSRKTELQFSTEKIKKLIEQSNLADPYTEEGEEFSMLDGEYDAKRMLATSATRILDHYFKKHPEDKIENYMD